MIQGGAKRSAQGSGKRSYISKFLGGMIGQMHTSFWQIGSSNTINVGNTGYSMISIGAIYL
jgi:hypothetical protein